MSGQLLHLVRISLFEKCILSDSTPLLSSLITSLLPTFTLFRTSPLYCEVSVLLLHILDKLFDALDIRWSDHHLEPRTWGIVTDQLGNRYLSLWLSKQISAR